MKIIIVTGELPHHKHLCVELSKTHNVEGIIHPRIAPGSLKKRWSRLVRRIRTYGIIHTFLNSASRLPKWLSGWEMSIEGRRAESEFFLTSVREYETLERRLIHSDVDVGSTAALEVIRRVGPDVVVCLGGPVYPKSFIESVPLMLNYHSGLSPLYNGASAVHFAFANGHPHLCGGTLMRMGAVVDGGDILGHYLPELNESDTPATLFMKTLSGTVKMYDRILGYLDLSGAALCAVTQKPPLFYYRGIDWTIYHARMVRWHLRKKLAAKHVRPERSIEYWRESDNEAAQRLYEITISQLLWGSL